MTFLRIVLFANGTGGDSTTYRPYRDESQWWNRRDALVRCVATALFGPSRPEDSKKMKAISNKNTTQLVILFDQDWSFMEMEYHQPNNAGSNETFFPSEQVVIALWKRAAQHPETTVRTKGLSCRLVPNKEFVEVISTQQRNFSMMSKRELLEYLQSNCTLEVLRQHRLNSSMETLLRKTNKQHLTSIAQSYKEQNTMPQQQTDDNAKFHILEYILKRFIQPVSDTIKKVLVATLHESSDHELPIWDHDKEAISLAQTNPSSEPIQICLFLGAVRDMTRSEHDCLERITGDGLMKVRLGPVPEFTSKILSVVSFHHYHGVLGPALVRLALEQQSPQRLSMKCKSNASNGTVLMHFICLVPLSSDEISITLADRSHILWSIVRCTVVSLWRSRLAGNQNEQVMLKNILTLLFLHDGVTLTLEQDDLVGSLASQHMAAPSEFQILKTLRDQIDSSSHKTRLKTETVSQEQILDLFRAGQHCMPSYIVNFCSKKEHNQNHQFYSEKVRFPAKSGKKDQDKILIVNLLSLVDPTDKIKDDSLQRIESTILQTAQNRQIPVVNGNNILDIGRCADREASVITMAQHLGYQNRLLPLLQIQMDETLSTKTLDSKQKKRRRNSGK